MQGYTARDGPYPATPKHGRSLSASLDTRAGWAVVASASNRPLGSTYKLRDQFEVTRLPPARLEASRRWSRELSSSSTQQHARCSIGRRSLCVPPGFKCSTRCVPSGRRPATATNDDRRHVSCGGEKRYDPQPSTARIA